MKFAAIVLRSLPALSLNQQEFARVLSKDTIVGDDRQPVGECLRDEHPVERIPVMEM